MACAPGQKVRVLDILMADALRGVHMQDGTFLLTWPLSGPLGFDCGNPKGTHCPGIGIEIGAKIRPKFGSFCSIQGKIWAFSLPRLRQEGKFSVHF